MGLLEEHGKPEREVYLDGENSGYLPDEVLEFMLPYFNKLAYGHPSITHRPGWEAYEHLMRMAEGIGKAIGASPQELTFTSGGTEANNLAIFGSAVRKGKIVTSAIEHLSVLHPIHALKGQGFQVVEIPVDKEGFFNLDALKSAIDKDVILVSLMAVNHEIGTIEPIEEVGKIVKDLNPNALFHVDACDALGRIPIDVNRIKADLLTLSAHKIHGPRGVGALYVKEGVKLRAHLHGQLSTNPYRPGVENLPLIAGFYKAVELAMEHFDENVSKMKRLRDMLLDGILERVDHVLVNGPRGDKRAPDSVNVSFLYCEGEAITVDLSLYGVYVSSGSACTSRVLEPSHVLKAIGRKHEEAHGSILMKVTRYHTEEDIKYVLEVIPKTISRLIKLSPVKPGGE